MYHPQLEEIVERDPRYTYEAYIFVFEALSHTQKLLGLIDEEDEEESGPESPHHVSGRELCNGIRDLALEEFGLMARVVLRLWGINTTGDFGRIVFNLIDAHLMSKTDQDNLDDFEDVYDLDEDLLHGYRITLPEDEES